MFGWLLNLVRPRVQPMNVMTINKSNILFNYGVLMSMHPNAYMFPVLKSNGYGHGLKEMLRIFKRLNLTYVVIDSIPEYYIVLNNSKFRMLMMGETLPHNYRMLNYERVTPCIWSVEILEKLLSLKKKIRVHLFIDTGMHREGLDQDELVQCLELLKNHPNKKNILIEGVMSHFADADGLGKDSLTKQIETFKSMYHTIVDYGYQPYFKHIGNSAGCLKVNDEYFNAWRPGLAMYGYNPLASTDKYFKQGSTLKPAMSITTRIVAIQQVKEGETLGYNDSWTADRDATVVTLPFGYTEGMKRNASGKIFAQYKEQLIQQVGHVCMNMSMFVLSEGLDAKRGDEVQLLSHAGGSKSSEHNTVLAWAQAADTIPYEILVGMPSNMRREIVL